MYTEHLKWILQSEFTVLLPSPDLKDVPPSYDPTPQCIYSILEHIGWHYFIELIQIHINWFQQPSVCG